MNLLVTYWTSRKAAEKTVAELRVLGIADRAFRVDLADAAARRTLLAQCDAALEVTPEVREWLDDGGRLIG